MSSPDRLSAGTCFAIIAVLSAVSWVGAAYFLSFVATHWRL